MTITGYKIVYDIVENDKKFTSEVQANDLPDYVREKIDQYLDYVQLDVYQIGEEEHYQIIIEDESEVEWWDIIEKITMIIVGIWFC